MATRLPKTALQMLNLGQVTKGVFVVVVLCGSDTAIKQHVTKCKLRGVEQVHVKIYPEPSLKQIKSHQISTDATSHSTSH